MDDSPTPRIRTASHDLPVSAELAAFLSGHWAATPPDDLRIPVAELTPARRARLSARFPGERLIVPAGGFTVRSNDFTDQVSEDRIARWDGRPRRPGSIY